MALLVDYGWLAIAVPLGLALIVAVLGSRAVPVTRFLAMLGPIFALAVGGVGLAEILGAGAREGEAAMLARGAFVWIAAGGRSIWLGWQLDGLAAVMLVVVGLVALMVMVFSGGYMHGERGLARYYAVLSLFTAAMAALVLADGFIPAFIGWEVMGACSYLLIGFWFDKPSASAAAMKAFLVTRVGDAGLLLGIGLLWAQGHWAGQIPLSFAGLGASVAGASGLAAVAALLVLAGAVGKSAQFPLHIWLPDAMEGPTPVSALIHAATMVAAGVFLVVRAWPLFAAAPVARETALALGTITALGAAFAALAQSDLKKVLAYSTISQLGFMFAALGAGSPEAAMFHLVTHAAFKSLLFLGAGSVIHGTGTQDMREMGALAKRMPVTTVTWIVGSAALAGIPPLAGFFSKDAVIHAVFVAQPLAGAALFLASMLTAFYITRATVLAFFGEPRAQHAHEALSMTGPLVVLAIPAAVAGFFGVQILTAFGAEAEPLNLMVATTASALALVGVAAAIAIYRRGPAADEAVAGALGSTWSLLGAAFHLDSIERTAFAGSTVAVSKGVYEALDRRVIDGAVEGVGNGISGLGRWMAKLQNGDAQWYSALVGAGVIAALAVALWAGR